ncbi:MAG: hypothetical protein LV480_08820 [Methylacidiphilales bacterium]|nr:hypothetical protein [Candidatus Methylacidiphilales bacterium]
MAKIFFTEQLRTLLTVLICFVAVFSAARGDDRFAITVGPQFKLVVLGPKGERVRELTVPSIAQPVSVGDSTFQVSYGRNAQGLLAAILAPSETAPADLHFTVMGKSVDADKAVVTLIFSQNLKHVTVRAGYGGRVEVNSRWIRQTEPTP